jgi:hypothetical protein
MLSVIYAECRHTESRGAIYDALIYLRKKSKIHPYTNSVSLNILGLTVNWPIAIWPTVIWPAVFWPIECHRSECRGAINKTLIYFKKPKIYPYNSSVFLKVLGLVVIWPIVLWPIVIWQIVAESLDHLFHSRSNLLLNVVLGFRAKIVEHFKSKTFVASIYKTGNPY